MNKSVEWNGFFADFYDSRVWIAAEFRIFSRGVMAEFSLFGYTLDFGWTEPWSR